jgi:hypothetical protein
MLEEFGLTLLAPFLENREKGYTVMYWDFIFSVRVHDANFVERGHCDRQHAKRSSGSPLTSGTGINDISLN